MRQSTWMISGTRTDRTSKGSISQAIISWLKIEQHVLYILEQRYMLQYRVSKIRKDQNVVFCPVGWIFLRLFPEVRKVHLGFQSQRIYSEGKLCCHWNCTLDNQHLLYSSGYLLGISPLKGLHQGRLNSLFGPPSQGKYHQFPYDYMDNR